MASQIYPVGKQVYRDFDTDGIATTPKHKPVKSEIRSWIKIINDEVQLLSDGQTSDAIVKSSWAALSATPGTHDGQKGEVYGDPGTHTDPVGGGSGTPNSGIFSWVPSSSGWLFVAPDTLSAKADKASTLTGAGAAVVTGAGNLGGNNTVDVPFANPSDMVNLTDPTKVTSPAILKIPFDTVKLLDEHNAAFVRPKLAIVGDSNWSPFCIGSDPSMGAGDKYGRAQYCKRSVFGWHKMLYGFLNMDSWYDHSNFVGTTKINGCNLAVSGEHVANYLSGSYSAFSEILRQSIDIVSLALGTNDVSATSGVDPAADALAISNNLLAAARKTTRLGKPTIVWTVPPRGDLAILSAGLALSDPRRTTLKLLLNNVRAWAATEPLVFLADLFEVLNGGITNQSDPNYTVMLPKYTFDGTHFTQRAGFDLAVDGAVSPGAVSVLNRVLKMIGLSRRRMRADVSAGNILPHARMNAFTTSAQSYVSGQVPVGFDIVRTSGSGSTFASLCALDSSGQGVVAIDITPNPAESSGSLFFETPVLNLPALAMAGYETAWPYALVDFSNQTDSPNFWSHIAVRVGSTSIDGLGDGFGPEYMPESVPTLGYVMIGPQFFIQNDMNTAQWALDIGWNGAGTTSGTGHIIVREVGLMLTTSNLLKLSFSAPALRGYDYVFYDVPGNFFSVIKTSP